MMLAATPCVVAAQIATFPPSAGADSQRVIPGARYARGGFLRFFLGHDYRDVWTLPIEAPVLDLDEVGGGLTPLRTGGFGQSVTLHFTGRDGRRYVARSMDKDPTKRLIPELKDTFVETIVQDQISALLPTAALVVDPLLERTGILHSSHTLVVIPDDPRLGEFRDTYAGMPGMLVLHPDEGADNTPGFAGSRRISGTDTFRDELEAGPCDRVDAREYLKARLVDMLIGDRDRHAGQWRWARYPAPNDCRRWVPIPEDRDQAFVDYDGVVMWATRLARPQQISFGPEYSNVVGLTFNAWELDRELLVELDRPTWDSVAAWVQEQLTDEVIDEAVRRLPRPHYEAIGADLTDALKRRRDHLPAVAGDYYRLISRWADILATDQDELLDVEHLSDGAVRVRIMLRDGSAPYFDRTFRPDVTDEVRVYMRGGDDSTVVRGGAAKITMRIDGGGGADVIVNESGAGAGRTKYYDQGAETRVHTDRIAVNRREFERPPAQDLAHRFALDWGGRGLTLPSLSYSPDIGLFMAATTQLTRFGYRKAPFAARHTISGGFATHAAELRLSYTGELRAIAPSVDGRIEISGSGIEIVRFHGFGNETDITQPSAFYKVDQEQVRVAPKIDFTPLDALHLAVGPVVAYADTDPEGNIGRFIADALPYGVGRFGQFGGEIDFTFDSRDVAANATRGMLIEAGASAFPAVWDATSAFGEVHGEIATYLTAPVTARPTLALRAGGKKVFGTYPFHEAAYLGGADDLRGFREERFAGDAAVFGNAELRMALGVFRLLFPTRFGIFGVADAGRVFFEGDPDDADQIHTAVGGGLWFSAIAPANTLTASIVRSDELTGVYVRAGFAF
jgi:hypothetical protein